MKIKNILATSLSILTMSAMAYVGVEAKQTDTSSAVIAELTEQKNCLAMNIYFEARGESVLGQRAVAWVTINRQVSELYPNSICEVVWQDKQFSWTHDGKSDKPVDSKAWQRANEVAAMVMKNYPLFEDPTEGSLMFHSTSVKPNWMSDYIKTSRIDNHIFYKKS